MMDVSWDPRGGIFLSLGLIISWLFTVVFWKSYTIDFINYHLNCCKKVAKKQKLQNWGNDIQTWKGQHLLRNAMDVAKAHGDSTLCLYTCAYSHMCMPMQTSLVVWEWGQLVLSFVWGRDLYRGIATKQCASKRIPWYEGITGMPPTVSLSLLWLSTLSTTSNCNGNYDIEFYRKTKGPCSQFGLKKVGPC